MKREHRKGIAEIRAADVGGRPGVTLHAIKPGVVDDYGSLWMADAFDESLATRLPTLCWSHDWADPLGPGLDFRTSSDGPEVDFAFSDFDAVPQARRAHAQVTDGTITDCSVGFSNTQRRDPTDAERKEYPGVREVILRSDLDEISLVLRGAVPGAKVLAVRTAGGQRGSVTVDQAVEVGRKVAAGDITLQEAKATLEVLAVDDDITGTGEEEPPVIDPTLYPGAAELEADVALDADLDAALELADRSIAR